MDLFKDVLLATKRMDRVKIKNLHVSRIINERNQVTGSYRDRFVCPSVRLLFLVCYQILSKQERVR